MNLFDSLPPNVPFEFREESEKAQAAQIAAGSEDARVELTMQNIREAFLYVKKCCKNKINDDEIVSLCYTTLYRNAKRFRPGKIRFFAFAKVALRGAISDYWSSIETVKNASKHYTDEPKMRGPMYRYKLGDEGGQYHEELTTTGIHLNERKYFEGDIFVDTVEPEFDLINIRERYAIVRKIVDDCLTAQERMILDLVYISGFTFEQIGELLDVTGSAAERTHSTAMKKIRRELKRRGQLL